MPLGGVEQGADQSRVVRVLLGWPCQEAHRAVTVSGKEEVLFQYLLELAEGQLPVLTIHTSGVSATPASDSTDRRQVPLLNRLWS